MNLTFDNFLLGIAVSAFGIFIAFGVGNYIKDAVSKAWGWVVVFAGLELTTCTIIIMVVLLNRS